MIKRIFSITKRALISLLIVTASATIYSANAEPTKTTPANPNTVKLSPKVPAGILNPVKTPPKPAVKQPAVKPAVVKKTVKKTVTKPTTTKVAYPSITNAKELKSLDVFFNGQVNENLRTDYKKWNDFYHAVKNKKEFSEANKKEAKSLLTKLENYTLYPLILDEYIYLFRNDVKDIRKELLYILNNYQNSFLYTNAATLISSYYYKEKNWKRLLLNNKNIDQNGLQHVINVILSMQIIKKISRA